MKKVISGRQFPYSVSSEDYNTFLEALDGDLSHFYYEIETPKAPTNGIKFNVVPFGDRAKYLPKIEVKTESEDGKIYLTPSMIMPERIDGDDLEFYDSFEYYMEGYVYAGKACTRIFKAVYTPGMYSDD